MKYYDIDNIKKIIHLKFNSKPFTCGDLYYSIEKEYNLSKFGTIRNVLVKLSQEGFVKYKIDLRGKPSYNSETKAKGAVYTLNK